jgi:hypothetical protein
MNASLAKPIPQLLVYSAAVVIPFKTNRNEGLFGDNARDNSPPSPSV